MTNILYFCFEDLELHHIYVKRTLRIWIISTSFFRANSDLFNKSIVRLIKKKITFVNKIIKDYILCDIKHVCSDLVSKPTSTALNLISPN